MAPEVFGGRLAFVVVFSLAPDERVSSEHC
jgi:hypothetical protein